MRKNKKSKWIILSICAVALVGWGALVVTIFNGDPKKPEGTPTPTGFIKTPGTVVVWCMTEEYERNPDGVRSLVGSFEYDDRGRCIKEERHYGPATETSEIFWKGKTYTYDEENHYVILRETYMGSGVSGVSDTSYDRAGIVRASVDYDLPYNGTLTKRFENTYDENGRLLGGRGFDRKTGEPDSEYVITRDINGEILSEKSFSAQSGKWEMTMSSQTDELGRAIKVYDVYESIGEPNRLSMEIQYHEDGSRTSLTYWDSSSGGRFVGTVYEYDRLGRRTEYRNLSEEGKEISRRATEYLETPDGTTEKKSRYGNGVLELTVEIRRNRNGKIIYLEECRYSEYNNGRTRLIETFYDEDGRVTRVVCEGVYELEYAYDEYGNCVMITETKDNGQVYYTEYVYTPVEISPEQAEENKLFYLPELIEDKAESLLRSIASW